MLSFFLFLFLQKESTGRVKNFDFQFSIDAYILEDFENDLRNLFLGNICLRVRISVCVKTFVDT